MPPGWYRVTSKNGALARETESMTSAKVREFAPGTVLHVDATVAIDGGAKTRARVTQPVACWITFKGLRPAPAPRAARTEPPARELQAARHRRWKAMIAAGEAYCHNDADAPWPANLACVLGHMNSVYCCCFAADGSRVVTGSWDRRVRVWDADSGERLRVFDEHADAVLSASPGPGTLVVTASWANEALVWDVATGDVLVALRSHAAAVNGVAWSSDGRRVVTASEDRTAKVWDAATGEELATLRGHDARKHRGDLWGCDVSSDGARAATASSDETAKLFDAATGACLRTFSGHGDRVTACAFSPDGSRLATSSWDGVGKIWDAATGACLHTLAGHAPPADANQATHGRLESVAFAPDGSRVATTSWDRTARVWDAATGARLETLAGHFETVYCCAFAPDGARLVTGAEDRTARVWILR